MVEQTVQHMSCVPARRVDELGVERRVLAGDMGIDWEYHADNFPGMVQLACGKILIRRLIRLVPGLTQNLQEQHHRSLEVRLHNRSERALACLVHGRLRNLK
jgi:hypothetical protein